MVNYSSRELTSVFDALADPVRCEMIARLARGPMTVGELGRPFSITKPAVTKHVKRLERAGLLRRRREGRVHHCTLEPRALEAAEAWIQRYRRFWEASLDRLARHVESLAAPGAALGGAPTATGDPP